MLILRYIFQGFLNVLLIPYLLWQGRRIRKKIPKLPEAKEPSGTITNGKSTQEILFLGESTLAGVGVKTHQEGFAGHFTKAWSHSTGHTISYDVLAKSGYKAKQVNEKLTQRIKDKSYALIIIGLGGNDSFQMTSPWKWEAEIRLLIATLKNKLLNVQIAFASTPPIHIFPAFPKLAQFAIGNWSKLHALTIAKVVGDYDNCTYHQMEFDLNHWYQKLNESPDINLLFSDGVHPSELTYKIWAEEMVESLQIQL